MDNQDMVKDDPVKKKALADKKKHNPEQFKTEVKAQVVPDGVRRGPAQRQTATKFVQDMISEQKATKRRQAMLLNKRQYRKHFKTEDDLNSDEADEKWEDDFRNAITLTVPSDMYRCNYVCICIY